MLLSVNLFYTRVRASNLNLTCQLVLVALLTPFNDVFELCQIILRLNMVCTYWVLLQLFHAVSALTRVDIMHLSSFILYYCNNVNCYPTAIVVFQIMFLYAVIQGGPKKKATTVK